MEAPAAASGAALTRSSLSEKVYERLVDAILSGSLPSGAALNVADIAQTHALLHGAEKQAHADAGYLGVEKRDY